MSKSKEPINPILQSALAPAPGAPPTAPVELSADDFIEAIVDESPSGAQGGDKTDPRGSARESRQMFAPIDPHDTCSPDEHPPTERPLPLASQLPLVEPRDVAREFAGPFAGQVSNLEAVGHKAKVAAHSLALAAIGEDEAEVQASAVAFANTCSALAGGDNRSTLNVLELFADFAGYVHASNPKDLGKLFVILRSVVALMAASRTLAENLPQMTGVGAQSIFEAYVFGMARRDDLAARGIQASEPAERRSHHGKAQATPSPKPPAPQKPVAPKPPPATKPPAVDKAAERERKAAEAAKRKAEQEAERQRAKEQRELEKRLAELIGGKGKKPK